MKQSIVGNKVIYRFLTDGEYEYKRKTKAKTEKVAARDIAFEEAIVETISEQPLNTAANVARVINEEWHEVTSLRLYRENSL